MRAPAFGPRASGSGLRAPGWPLCLVLCAVCLGPVPAAAQQPVQFLPRFDFYFAAEYLSDDDRRFEWDADLGGEVDVVDYGVGRATFTANYEVVMGTQLRRFDPNQGNYILAGSASARAGALEVAGMFYHQSRHLSDRPKLGAIDWNMVGARVAGDMTRGRTEWQARADVRGVVQKSFVDYQWEIDAEGGGRMELHPRVSLISSAGVRVLGVDGTRDRGTQTGFLAEGGARFEGTVAAMEFFVAAERRIDPFPVEFGTATWLKAGFRLLTR